jgi:lambda family phage portal protein
MKLSLELFGRNKPDPELPAKTGKELLDTRTVTPKDVNYLRQVSRQKIRMYDSAATSRLNQDFPISITSANAEILTSIVASRSRARRLERDNPYATAIINSHQNNVVGSDPFRLEMKVGKMVDGAFIEEDETNLEIEQAWQEAGLPENFSVRKTLSRAEGYWQTISAVIRDGGIIWRQYRQFPKNDFHYAVDILETDHLDYNWNRPQVGTANEIQFSIEMDEFHAPVAYHLLTRHPGDVFAWSNSPQYRERVDAADIIALWNIRTRAEQYIGMPSFCSIIQRLHRLDQYDVAEMTAAIVSACKMGFFKKDATGDEYTGDAETEEGAKEMTASPGTFEELPAGYGVEPWDPNHPVEAYPNFTKQNLRAVAGGAGLAYHVLANDLEGVNFSSGRLGENQQRAQFKKLQMHMKLNLVRPHFSAWLKYAILSCIVKQPIDRLPELIKAAHFHAQKWGQINPVQDTQADIMRIEAGLDSRDHVILNSERGGDTQKVDAEIAADKKIDEDHDLDFSGTDATLPTIKKGAPGETLPNPEDEVAPPAPPPKKGGKQTIKKKSRLPALNGNGHALFMDI